MRPAEAYARAGVDLETASRAKEQIKALARSTFFAIDNFLAANSLSL